MRYKILFKEKPDIEKLKKIREKHHKDIEGIAELYDSLIENETCDSEIASRIYYVAYSLALEKMELILVRV